MNHIDGILNDPKRRFGLAMFSVKLRFLDISPTIFQNWRKRLYSKLKHNESHTWCCNPKNVVLGCLCFRWNWGFKPFFDMSTSFFQKWRITYMTFERPKNVILSCQRVFSAPILCQKLKTLKVFQSCWLKLIDYRLFLISLLLSFETRKWNIHVARLSFIYSHKSWSVSENSIYFQEPKYLRTVIQSGYFKNISPCEVF